MTKEDFTQRLTTLRIAKGASARDMSLSLGQSPSYINNIESGKNLPSFHMFFYMCEYLHVTPREFFDTEILNPSKVNDLITATKGLSNEQLDHLIALAKGIRPNR